MARLTYKDIVWVSVHNYIGTINWTYNVCIRDGNTTRTVRYSSGSMYRECNRVPKCVLKFIRNGKLDEKNSDITFKTYVA